MQTQSLVHHSSTPDEAVRALTVTVESPAADVLVMRYRLDGAIDRLKVPTRTRSGSRDGLWQHTCFEAFIAVPDSEAYFEFNFSPSSEWAIYRFQGYRSGPQPLQPSPPPRLACRREGETLAVDVEIQLGPLAELAAAAKARRKLPMAISAVVENVQERISYWALAHPPGKPDFHHRAGFVLTLPGDVA